MGATLDYVTTIDGAYVSEKNLRREPMSIYPPNSKYTVCKKGEKQLRLSL